MIGEWHYDTSTTMDGERGSSTMGRHPDPAVVHWLIADRTIDLRG
jgi:hypothetical protein